MKTLKVVNQEHINHITSTLVGMYHNNVIPDLISLSANLCQSLTVYLAATEAEADLPMVVSAFDKAMSEAVPAVRH